MRTLFLGIMVICLLFGGLTHSDAQWVQSSGLPGVPVWAFAPSDTNLLASNDYGVFLSMDGGMNWTSIGSGLPHRYTYSALAVSDGTIFAGTRAYGVYRSTDFGGSWTVANTGLTGYTHQYGMYDTVVQAFAVSGAMIFAGTYAGVFLTTDNGANWNSVSAGLPNFFGLHSIILDSTNLIAGGYGVYISTDYGGIWTGGSGVVPDSGIFSLTASGENLFAGTYNDGVFLSTNIGTTWTSAAKGLPTPKKYVYSLAISGQDLFAGTSSGVFFSSDNGTNWADFGLSNHQVYSLVVSGLNLIAGTDSIGVWRRPLSDALPIQLASLTAMPISSGCIELEWETLSETNNYGFQIQKRRLPSAFSSIPNAFVQGHGTTLIVHQYRWVDSSAHSGEYYRLKQTDLDGLVHFSDGVQAGLNPNLVEGPSGPTQFHIEQNYPNPFNPTTAISYALPHKSEVTITIFNTLGQEISLLVRETQDAGYHEVKFDGSGLASGIYFYRFQAGSFLQTKKLLLLK